MLKEKSVCKIQVFGSSSIWWRCGDALDGELAVLRGGKEGDMRDQVVSILFLLEASKGHLSARDVFLGILEVLKLNRVSRRFGRSILRVQECPPSK